MLDSNLIARSALGSYVESFSNPHVPDPNESEMQQLQLSNGLRQAEAINQKIMQDRQARELSDALSRQEYQDMVDLLHMQAHKIHGDNLWRMLDRAGIQISLYRDNKKLTRLEAYQPFLTMFKLARKLTDSGEYKAPGKDEQDLMLNSGEEIDKMEIYLRKKRRDGSYVSYSLEGLTRKFDEKERKYIKYAFFTSLDKNTINDIEALNQYYAMHGASMREKELKALWDAFLVGAIKVGPPTNDPSGKTRPWKELLADKVQRTIPGFQHKGHLPFRFDLILPSIVNAGYLAYDEEHDRNYTAQDFLLMKDLPKKLTFVSLSTGERYSLEELMANPAIQNIHKDPKAFSDNVEEYYAYWNHEFHGAQSLAAVQMQNREIIQKAIATEMDAAKRTDMLQRCKYEEFWIHERIQELKHEEARCRIVGEYSIAPSMESFATAVASILNLKDEVRYTSKIQVTEDGSIAFQETHECAPDPNIWAIRAADISENAPNEYNSMTNTLMAISLPVSVGMTMAAKANLVAAIQSSAAQAEEQLQQNIALMQLQDEKEQNRLDVEQAGINAGVNAGITG